MNKKRYAGLYWTNPDKHDKMDTKGIETVRRDSQKHNTHTGHRVRQWAVGAPLLSALFLTAVSSSLLSLTQTVLWCPTS